MSERTWIEPWPKWAVRWYGIALRALIGLLGTLAGLGLVWLAGFAATFKKDQPEWDGEALTFLFLGVASALAAIALAFRPSRVTFVFAAMVAAAIPIAGSIV